MAPNPDRSGMLALGSFSGAAALLDPRSRQLLCLLEGGHAGGVTHVRCCCSWEAGGLAGCKARQAGWRAAVWGLLGDFESHRPPAHCQTSQA